MIDRSLIRHIDWVLIGLLLLNSIIGIAFIYSSTHYLPTNYLLKQIIWIIFSLIALFLFLMVDYKVLVSFSIYFYILAVLALMGVLLFGRLVAGAKSWIHFPFFRFNLLS